MPRTPLERFTFRQKYIQNEGGWCAGISTVLAEKAIEAASGQVPRPEGAFEIFKDQCSQAIPETLLGSLLLPKFERRQKQIDSGCFGVKNLSGYYAYSFQGCGVAILNLSVDKTTSIWSYGVWFQWRTSSICFASMNHAGAVVWDQKKIFVFDPNVGGTLWNMPGWSFSSLIRYSVPALIDEALEYMYKMDSENKHRRSRIRSAAIVKQSTKSVKPKSTHII